MSQASKGKAVLCIECRHGVYVVNVAERAQELGWWKCLVPVRIHVSKQTSDMATSIAETRYCISTYR